MDILLFSSRSIWTMFHGIVLGGGGLIAVATAHISLLDAIGVISVPALYVPAGGVTGRTTLGVLIWLIAWGILHRRWKDEDVEAGGVHSAAIVLTVLGILLALPPVWAVFE